MGGPGTSGGLEKGWRGAAAGGRDDGLFFPHQRRVRVSCGRVCSGTDGKPPSSFYEVNFTLIPKLDKNAENFQSFLSVLRILKM